MASYTFILFDADNTILDFDRGEAVSIEKTVSSYNTTIPPDRYIPLYREINRQIWEEFVHGEISQKELKIQRFRRFLSAIELPEDPEELSRVYLSHLAESHYFIEDAEYVLEKLKGKHTLGLITNGLTKVQKPRFRKAGLHRFFSALVISEELGIAKPDPEIFSVLCDQLGAKNKKNILMVGDSLSSDVAGGRNFGIDTCWFNPEGQKNSGNVIPDYQISSLKELLSLLS